MPCLGRVLHDGGMVAGRRIAVVSVTAARPQSTRYHAYSELLARRVVDAIGRAGGSAVRVFAADGGSAARSALSGAHGVVLLGGEDIAPEFYGASRGYEREGLHHERADEVQLGIAERAVRDGLPLLGVCRGLQILDVALGGTLVQHLEDGSGHRTEAAVPEQVFTGHDVDVVRGSRLHALLGSTTAATASAHHQAVDRLGAGLVVSATAPDGTVEAIEHVSAPALGVQWHPEAPSAAPGQLHRLLGAFDSALLAA
jgi:putative glutamine amidotransferase